MGPKPSLLYQSSALFLIIIIFCNHSMISKGQINDDELEITISIGAIIDSGSRVGKEAKVAMEIAQQSFNNRSSQHKLSIYFKDTKEDPFQPAYTELIREKDVQALITSTETWDKTVLVADIGNRTRVPVISITSVVIPQPLAQLQWPYLVQMSRNFSQQIKCVASIIGSFRWRNVIAIYELDRYGGDSGTFSAFSEELQGIGVNVEHRLVLPAFDSFSYPNTFIHRQVHVLKSKSSKVFVILGSSISLLTHLLSEAKDSGLMDKDSTWIVMEDIASQLHSLNPSLISLMEGFLGITTYYSEEKDSFLNFRRQFRQSFQSEFPDQNNLDMGINALRAHDSVVAIVRAATKNKLSIGSNSTTENTLLNTILSINFTGLSGDIQFGNGELSQSVYNILNIRKNVYINNYSIGFWSPEMGFSKSLGSASDGYNHNMEVLAGLIEWPGNLKSQFPKGWSMTSNAKRLQIGVPGRTTLDKFVYVDWNQSKDGKYPVITGFCIDVFLEVQKILEKRYPLPYDFIPYNGTYDALVDQVANKTYDAVIGDVTILADRSEHVEFTQPFVESGLTMLVPKNNHDKTWIFLRPFTKEMWAVTVAILIYTVFIVWLLERNSNQEFGGTWQDQLSIAVWFTFSSVFFAQREQVRSNYTRVVVVVWLIVVLILTNSYTASLSSLLTVNRIQSNIDIKWLIDNDAIIGSDTDYIRRYLQEVLGFKPQNIKANISIEYDLIGELESSKISAAFLESPYESAFTNKYCNRYAVPVTTTNEWDRFGGLGFVFQIGSPIARDVSEAILILLENGTIKQLHKKWFAPSSKCKTAEHNDDSYSLNWNSFWGLFSFSAATSTICYLTFLARKRYGRYHERRGSNIIRMLNYRNGGRKLAELLLLLHWKTISRCRKINKADQNQASTERRSFDQIELA